MDNTPSSTALRARLLMIGIWIARSLVAFVFLYSAYLKLTTPIATLSAAMPWTGVAPEAFVRTMGVIDLTGGLGLVLPALTGILPWLSTVAAGGCTLVQVLAIGMHTWRGEAAVTPLNYVLLALCLFILWSGRWLHRATSPR